MPGLIISYISYPHNKNKLNGTRTYVYRHKHNFIPYSTFTITKVQLHVSAINVGHLQVVHEALNDKLYLHVSGEVTVCEVGWVRENIDILTKPPKQTRSIPLLQTQNEISHPPHPTPQTVTSHSHVDIANIDGRNI